MTEKESVKSKLERRFNRRFKEVIVYKNPNEFTTLYIEKVNPNHIGIVWGRRHKKFNKGTHYIKCAKVFFSMLPSVVGLSVAGWIDAVTGYVYNVLLSIGIFGLALGLVVCLLLYGFPFFKVNTWTLRA